MSTVAITPGTDTLLRVAIEDAALAPSAHNTQPARWQVAPDGRLILLEDTARRLPFGDPTGRDHLLSLGAAFEGMDLALSRLGWRLGDPEPLAAGSLGRSDDLLPVASARLVACAQVNPLAGWVRQRRTHRGLFPAASATLMAALATLLERQRDVAVAQGSRTLRQVASLYDDSLVSALAPEPVLSEMRSWMRLTPAETGSPVDGLTAETLLLGPLLARAADVVLRPAPFAALRALGLARALVSEAQSVRSATALLVLHGESGSWPLLWGRELYRVWLELTAHGFSACPMSALLDVSGGEAEVARLAGLPVGRVPYAVLRVGPNPASAPPRSPRLPAERLIAPPAVPGNKP